MNDNDVIALQQRIDALEKRIGNLELMCKSEIPQHVSPGSHITVKQISPKEFLLQKSANSDVERTFYLAYYLEIVKGDSSFNVDSLRETFKLAKTPTPTNLNDCINKNITKDLFMETGDKKDDKKSWALTATGEKSVENDLNK